VLAPAAATRAGLAPAKEVNRWASSEVVPAIEVYCTSEPASGFETALLGMLSVMNGARAEAITAVEAAKPTAVGTVRVTLRSRPSSLPAAAVEIKVAVRTLPFARGTVALRGNEAVDSLGWLVYPLALDR